MGLLETLRKEIAESEGKDTLDLSEENISNSILDDIKGDIKELSSMYILDLSQNALTHVDALNDMESVLYLSISDNQLTDIRALQKLPKLQKFDATNNQLTDINSLIDLTKMDTLRLGNNQLTDINALQRLTSLIDLFLYENQLKEISPVKNMKSLETLYIHSNILTDISPLEDLHQLTLLDISYNQITNLDPIKNLKNLNSLDASFNKINMKALQNFVLGLLDCENVSLEEVNLIGNPFPTKISSYKVLLLLIERNKKLRHCAKYAPNLAKVWNSYAEKINKIKPEVFHVKSKTRSDFEIEDSSSDSEKDENPLAKFNLPISLQVGESQTEVIKKIITLIKHTYRGESEAMNVVEFLGHKKDYIQDELLLSCLTCAQATIVATGFQLMIVFSPNAEFSEKRFIELNETHPELIKEFYTALKSEPELTETCKLVFPILETITNPIPNLTNNMTGS